MYSMRRLLALMCCLAWPAIALALDGRIIDAATGLPIAGALVSSGYAQAISDANGHYALPVSSPRLLARAIGYARARIPVVTASGAVPAILLHALRPKALYLSAYGIDDKRLREAALQLLDTTELNALVIDLKSDRGQVPYPTQVLEATRCGARSVTTVHDMRALVTQLKNQGVYLIARIVAFKDELSATAHPEWAAMPRASAMNSLVFLSSAPSRVAARARSPKPFMTSGISVRRVASWYDTDCVNAR
jgi:hypothetical protein